MSARVRVSGDHSLEVVGHGDMLVWDYTDEEGMYVAGWAMVGTFEVAGPAYLYSLRQALLKWRREDCDDPELPVVVCLIPGAKKVMVPELQDAAASPALLLKGERLLVQVATGARTESERGATHDLLAPFLRRHKASSEDVEGEIATVAIDWPTKGRTVADAWRFGEEVEALLAAVDGGELGPALVLDLLRAGRKDLLLDQPESDWLEAKGEPYDHLIGDLGANWRYELAKDVAAFANSPQGGLIVIGMITKNRGDGDVIRGHKEFALHRVKRQAYRNHVAQLVYPRLTGFEVESVEGSRKGHGIAVLSIPPQPESSRPFLVQGVLSRGRVLGSHVLFPVRREDDTALMDAAALHARIRLGEQVIAGK